MSGRVLLVYDDLVFLGYLVNLTSAWFANRLVLAFIQVVVSSGQEKSRVTCEAKRGHRHQ